MSADAADKVRTYLLTEVAPAHAATWAAHGYDARDYRVTPATFAIQGGTSMSNTVMTVDCFDVELDNGESLADLGIGNYLELREPAAGMQPGTWMLTTYHGDFRDRATLRLQTAADIAVLRETEADKLRAFYASVTSTPTLA
ncbi:hypothetical protein [Streptomyces sp. NPDC060366]|uniref:hypothetical protein n=1 Tax=Streptomyces sp. NPDC060366 TaxID=3347105 RepID=UPI003661812B